MVGVLTAALTAVLTLYFTAVDSLNQCSHHDAPNFRGRE